MKRTHSKATGENKKDNAEKEAPEKKVKGAKKAAEKLEGKKVPVPIEEEKKGEEVEKKPGQAMNKQIIEQIERLMKYY